ncbi:hypothetical protein E3N88_29019 [Mikania micrantha]|uniref:Uncharacterized protein n=1 Tax=Mikania micrantha TaxID=192012 RepID=A0A5N6N1G7_9ASTR|nr:hypothetical protein E3N88_29019 [Mikania micrantha]
MYSRPLGQADMGIIKIPAHIGRLLVNGVKRLIIINNNMLSSPVCGGTVAGRAVMESKKWDEMLNYHQEPYIMWFSMWWDGGWAGGVSHLYIMCNVNNLIIPIITHDIAPREPSARRGLLSNPAGSGHVEPDVDHIVLCPRVKPDPSG